MENVPMKTEAGLPAMAMPGEQVILNTDIIIPQLLLMQGLSEFVAEKKRCPLTNTKIDTGMFVRSTTMEILGGEEKAIRIIPLKMVANWKIEEKIGDKFEYRQTIARTAANENLDWNFKQNGTDWRRVKVLDVFALLPSDILAYEAEMKKVVETGAMPDLNKTLMPVMIRFKSTSFKAGMSVNTFFAQIRDLRRFKPDAMPHGYTLELSTYQDKNDDGPYYVFKAGDPKPVVKDPKAPSPEELVIAREAERWYNTLAALSSVRVDEGADSENGSAKNQQF